LSSAPVAPVSLLRRRPRSRGPVLIIEAADRAGGSTALSGGVFYAAGTAVQRARGIDGDTPDAMFQYYMTLNQYKLEPALVRRLCDEAPAALEWLTELGVEFPESNLYVAGVDKIARGHRAAGMGLEIATVLEGACNRSGVDLVTRTRVRELCLENGRVVGVRVDGEELRTNAVVIATGGFGNNPSSSRGSIPTPPGRVSSPGTSVRLMHAATAS
jgi:fumarate reductase flavoprotein subunit